MEADRASRETALGTKVISLSMSVFDEDHSLVHRARLELIHEAGDDCWCN